MKRFIWSILLSSLAFGLAAQSFEVGQINDVYRGFIGENMRVPLQFTNTTDKPLTLIVRRVSANLGGTQRSYFCPEKDCLDQRVEDVMVRLEPGQTHTGLEIGLDAGLANGISSVKYIVYNRHNSAENFEFDLNFAVEERAPKPEVFIHPQIVLHEVYPNPIVDHAYVNYNLVNEDVEAKIVVHDILGNSIEEYMLPAGESRVKIRAESLSAGIYFFTLYLDNEGVVTRKLIVKK